MPIEFLCISVLRETSRPKEKLAGLKSALNTQWFILLTVLRLWSYSLLLCGLFYEAIYFKSCPVLFYSCIFSFLALRLPRLGKRELNLVLFVRFSICVCLVLSVSSSSLCLKRAAACDCGTPWSCLLPFHYSEVYIFWSFVVI